MKINKVFNTYERPESWLPKDSKEKVGKVFLFFADNALGSKITTTGIKTDKVSNKLFKVLSGIAAFTVFLPLSLIGIVLIKQSKSFGTAEQNASAAKKSTAEKVQSDALEHFFSKQLPPLPPEPSLKRKNSIQLPKEPQESKEPKELHEPVEEESKKHTEILKKIFPNGEPTRRYCRDNPYDSRSETEPEPVEPDLTRRKSGMPTLPPAPSRVNSMELPKKPLLPPEPSMKREEILDPEDLHGLSETEKPPSFDDD